MCIFVGQFMEPIRMVDLKRQYHSLKKEIDAAVLNVLEHGQFINGPEVSDFKENLSNWLSVKHVIPCANGTDALQIAIMAAGLRPGDEVITSAFTFIATAEVLALLGIIPVFADVNPDTFTIDPDSIRRCITPQTRAIIPVHLFGQCCDMEEIGKIATEFNLIIIEDNAQAIGAKYTYSSGEIKMAGTMGYIGTTSFFPSKNLGAYGDAGAIFTQDDHCATIMSEICNHGQTARYIHDRVGINSRLDTIQAAILCVKQKHIEKFTKKRQILARQYSQSLSDIPGIQCPVEFNKSTHVYHQYTILVNPQIRESLINFLSEKSIPVMIYYSIPLHHQKMFNAQGFKADQLINTERLSKCVLSLPMHTEMDHEQFEYINQQLHYFFNNI